MVAEVRRGNVIVVRTVVGFGRGMMEAMLGLVRVLVSDVFKDEGWAGMVTMGRCVEGKVDFVVVVSVIMIITVVSATGITVVVVVGESVATTVVVVVGKVS